MGKRNPNRYGCVTKLKGNRSRPWMIRVTVYDAEGHGRQVPIDYAATEQEANIILAKYNNNPWNIDRNKVTLAELYQRWAEVKMPQLGRSSQYSMQAAFRHCSKLYGFKYREIRSYHMQSCIDQCDKGATTKSAIKTLWGHLDRFAYEIDVVDKMYSQLITAPAFQGSSRTPFTEEQIVALWKIQDEPWVDTVLIYIYTGFRLTELLNMKRDQVNTEEWYFQGGIKTAAGKERIVPIHDRIKPLVQKLLEQNTTYLFMYEGKKFNDKRYYECWNEVMEKIGAEKTPHEARHTFETRLDNAHGNRKCIDMLMGHKSKDVGNRVYNHKTIDQLRETIALLE